MRLMASKIIWFFVSKVFSLFLRYNNNIYIGKAVFFNKLPNITVHKQSRLIINDNVTINSNNSTYHINMHSKCKLLLDRPGAEVTIGENSRIHGTCIHAYSKINIGKNCLIAANTQIIDGNGHELCFDFPAERINSIDNGKPILIKDNVWIGANCIVLGGTTINEGAVISAGSVVKGIIPKNSLFGGNPARLIKQF